MKKSKQSSLVTRKAKMKGKKFIFLFLVPVFALFGCGPTVKEIRISNRTHELTVRAHYEDVCRIFHERAMAICGDVYEPIGVRSDRGGFGPMMTITGKVDCPKKGVWRREELTTEEFKRDTYQCKTDATILSELNRSKDFCELMFKGKRYMRIFKDCMEAKGYIWVESNP